MSELGIGSEFPSKELEAKGMPMDTYHEKGFAGYNKHTKSLKLMGWGGQHWLQEK